MEPKNFDDLYFLASKSREFIDKQITSYRQKHANAGSVIAIIALFIPFFLKGLNDSHVWFKIISIIPVGMFLIAVWKLLDVLKTKSLDQGFHPKKFIELVQVQDLEKILLYEIGANVSSFNDNEKITDEANKSFNLGVKLTLYAVVISIILLVGNNFYQDNSIQKVQLVNSNNMANENVNPNTSNDGSSGTSSDSSTPRDIPVVPPTDRINLNETIVDIKTKIDTGKKGQ